MIKLWRKYIFLKTLGIMTFFILCFNLMYFIIDYSIHAGHFWKDTSTSFSEIFVYYFFQWIKRLDLILPLSLLLSSIKVLTSLNQSNELMSLRLGGLSLKSLAAPLFLLGLISTTIVLLNFEFLIPSSLSYIERFENLHFKQMTLKKHEKKGLYFCRGNGGQTILYQRFNPLEQALEDVYIIDSFQELWKMKKLSFGKSSLLGQFVDFFKRDEMGHLQKESSFLELPFTNLSPFSHLSRSSIIQAENKSLSQLLSRYHFSSEKESYFIRSHLTYKIVISLLSLLTILVAVPFSTSFSRNFPTFLTYTFSLFGFIVLITIMDAMMIIAESGVALPEVLLITPMALVSLLFTTIFIRRSY